VEQIQRDYQELQRYYQDMEGDNEKLASEVSNAMQDL